MSSSSKKWISVTIETKTQDGIGVVVDVPDKNIIAIRYAWHKRPCNYKRCAIYSAAGKIPTPPFICYIRNQTRHLWFFCTQNSKTF